MMQPHILEDYGTKSRELSFKIEEAKNKQSKFWEDYTSFTTYRDEIRKKIDIGDLAKEESIHLPTLPPDLTEAKERDDLNARKNQIEAYIASLDNAIKALSDLTKSVEEKVEEKRKSDEALIEGYNKRVDDVAKFFGGNPNFRFKKRVETLGDEGEIISALETAKVDGAENLRTTFNEFLNALKDKLPESKPEKITQVLNIENKLQKIKDIEDSAVVLDKLEREVLRKAYQQIDKSKPSLLVLQEYNALVGLLNDETWKPVKLVGEDRKVLEDTSSPVGFNEIDNARDNLDALSDFPKKYEELQTRISSLNDSLQTEWTELKKSTAGLVIERRLFDEDIRKLLGRDKVDDIVFSGEAKAPVELKISKEFPKEINSVAMTAKSSEVNQLRGYYADLVKSKNATAGIKTALENFFNDRKADINTLQQRAGKEIDVSLEIKKQLANDLSLANIKQMSEKVKESASNDLEHRKKVADLLHNLRVLFLKSYNMLMTGATLEGPDFSDRKKVQNGVVAMVNGWSGFGGWFKKLFMSAKKRKQLNNLIEVGKALSISEEGYGSLSYKERRDFLSRNFEFAILGEEPSGEHLSVEAKEDKKLAEEDQKLRKSLLTEEQGYLNALQDNNQIFMSKQIKPNPVTSVRIAAKPAQVQPNLPSSTSQVSVSIGAKPQAYKTAFEIAQEEKAKRDAKIAEDRRAALAEKDRTNQLKAQLIEPFQGYVDNHQQSAFGSESYRVRFEYAKYIISQINLSDARSIEIKSFRDFLDQNIRTNADLIEKGKFVDTYNNSSKLSEFMDNLKKAQGVKVVEKTTVPANVNDSAANKSSMNSQQAKTMPMHTGGVKPDESEKRPTSPKTTQKISH